MAIKIIVTLVSILALAFSLSKQGLFQKIITFGLALSTLLLWFNSVPALFYSIVLHLLLAVLSVFYAWTVKNVNSTQKFIIGATGLLLTLGTYSMIAHYPGLNFFRLTLIIPVILFFITAIKKGRQQPKEFGFMSIWITYSVIQIILYFFK